MPQMQPGSSPRQAAQRNIKGSFAAMQDSVVRYFNELHHKLTHLPQTNYDLGMRFAAKGQAKDAAFRFKVALYFAPAFTQAWYNLGCCQLALGQRDKAVESLRKTLRLEPTHADAKFMLATIDPALLQPQDRPQRMPHHMMEGFFGRVAPHYNLLEGEMKYAGPQALHQRLRQKLGRGDVRILDVGCGTGLGAMPWRKEAQYMVGVDATPEMATVARGAQYADMRLYDEVLTTDVNTPEFALGMEPFDLAFALHVLPYVGEAAQFIRHMAEAVKPGGMVAVTHEPHSGTGFGIVPATGRFGHSVEYLRQLAVANGLQPLAQETLALYPEVNVSLLTFTKQVGA